MSAVSWCIEGHTYGLVGRDLLWCRRCGSSKRLDMSPQPDVADDKYRHYIADQDTVGAGGVLRSLCGKVYEPADDDAEVVRLPCPDCSYALTDGVWTS